MARKYDPFSKQYVGYIQPTAIDTSQIVPGFYFKSHNLQHHYTVIENMYGTAALNGRTSSAWQGKLGWLDESVNFRGFQLSVPWGLYETGAAGGGDFSNLDHLEAVVNEIGAKGKYVILMPFQFREFRNGDVTSLSVDDQMRYLLPADMRTKQSFVNGITVLQSQGATIRTVTSAPANSFGVNGDYAHNATTNILYGPKAGGVWPAGVDLDTNDTRAHWLWDNAYSYTKAFGGAMGFDMKIYKQSVKDRMARFQQAVADKFNANPTVIGITTTESAPGAPAYLGALAGGIVDDGYDAVSGIVNVSTNCQRAILSAKTSILQTCRPYYPNKWFAQDINTPLNTINYVKEYFDQAQANKMGATSSDTVWYNAALVDQTEPTVGCLVRMSNNSSVMPVMCQWQQYCWESSFGGAPVISSTQDYLDRFADIFAMTTSGNAKVGFGINAHMVLIQTESVIGMWTGGTYNPEQSDGSTNTIVTVPSLKTWLKNKFTAEGINDGSGGLNTVRPSLYVGYNS